MAYNDKERDNRILYAMLNSREDTADAFALYVCANRPALRSFVKCNHKCDECYLKRVGNEMYQQGWRRVPDDARVISYEKYDEYKEKAVRNEVYRTTRRLLRDLYRHNEEVNGGIGNDYVLECAKKLGIKKCEVWE